MIFVKFADTNLQYLFPILFADDANLFKEETKLETLELVWIMNYYISLWLEVNKPLRNCKKTHHIIFRKRKNSFNSKLSIDGESINEIDQTKFLGILIDDKLRWKQHIAYISGKISGGIGLLRRVII